MTKTARPQDPIDLAALAADLSRNDGDGRHWNEDEAKQWLLRMGLVIPGDANRSKAEGVPSTGTDQSLPDSL